MVNNNSSDKSQEIANYWVNQDSRFRLVQEEKQGVVYASNTGARHASGKYIARMDADDWSFEKRIELQSEFLDKNPDFDAIAGQVEYVSHKDDTEGFRRYVDWNNSIISYKEILKKRFIEMPIINPTCMWRKKASDKHGLYKKGDFPEDYEMWLRWLNNGAKIKKINKPLLKWFDSETRLTRTHPIYSDKYFYQIKTKYLVKWLKKNNPFHPNVVVWGASKISRRRARLIESQGIKIEAYIDTKKSRQIDKKIIYYKDVAPDCKYFILCYIKQMDARKKIIDYLSSKNYIEGINFLLVS